VRLWSATSAGLLSSSLD
jgi:hypothetical protein